MKKDLEAKQEFTRAVAKPDLTEWTDGVGVSRQDIVIPTLLPMQAMSDKVTGGQAAFGELRDNVANKLFADFNSSVEMIPFYLMKEWIVYKIVPKRGGEDVEWVRTETITTQTDDLPYEFEENGEKFKRVRVLKFFMLNTEELAKGFSLPYAVPFKVTSLRAGKKLSTQMYVQNVGLGLSPAAYTINLKALKESNDKGTYAVLDFSVGRRTTQEEEKACLEWLRVIKVGQAKVAEAEEMPF